MANTSQGNIKQSILICGTGALATLFAARLCSAGHPVKILGGWEEGLHAINQGGVRLVDLEGNEHTCAVEATRDPADCRDMSFALVLVKSWQTEHVADQLVKCLAQDGVALTLQNGLGNRELLTDRLGENRVALGATTTGATLLEPGLARAGGEGLISMETHPHIRPLKISLLNAGFKVQMVDDADALVWGKLVINAAINPLTALLRVPNGELLKRPTAKKMMSVLAQEVAAIATAQGIQLPFSDAALAAEEVARNTATNHSSMYQDIVRGAPTEIDAICGAITKLGEKLKLPTPFNQVCWYLVRAKQPITQPPG